MANYVYASCQGQHTYSARTNSLLNCGQQITDRHFNKSMVCDHILSFFLFVRLDPYTDTHLKIFKLLVRTKVCKWVNGNRRQSKYFGKGKINWIFWQMEDKKAYLPFPSWLAYIRLTMNITVWKNHLELDRSL